MQASAFVVWLDEAGAEQRRIGGKGAGLTALLRGGFPVPPGFVVTADAYDRFVQTNALPPAIDALLATANLALPRVAREASAPLAERLTTARLPEEVVAETSTAYEALRGSGGAVVAVRSSALSEDSGAASSAGLYESYLNLRDLDAVLDAVRRSYASLWSVRAVQYRARRGVESRGEAMAVVVMALVSAESAGVAFTVNPVTGDRGQIVINASWGLGEAVVSGQVTPDSFTLAKDGLAILDRQVFEKEIEIVPDPDGRSGTLQRSVAPARRAEAALSARELRTLGELCLAIEQLHGRPVDIEWALAAGAFSILQARPVTALA